MLELVESIPRILMNSMADSSEILTMPASARQKTGDVALSGDGGDEFFCATRCTETRTGAEARCSGRFGYGGPPAARTQTGKPADAIAFRKDNCTNRDKRYKTQLCSDRYLPVAKPDWFGPGALTVS